MQPRDSLAVRTTRTTCPYCGVGCGVLVKQQAARIEITGDPEHPANFGRLCSKGAALGETLGHEHRLLQPHIDGRAVDWERALGHVAQRLGDIIRQHGPQAVALYVSGQLLTEDYYVANKLMKGFIGTANIDTNSRLCMSSAVAGHKRAFGEDLVPVSYDDLELADLVVLVGSNAAWCHPVLFQRILHAQQQRPTLQIVVIDPRRTPTCEFADLHLPIRAGTDVWLFNGLLAFLHQQGASDANFVAQHTAGLEHALLVAENTAGDLHAVAKQCRVDAQQLRQFYERFARTERTLTLFSQGVNQSSSGTDKVNSIINCHLLTARLGRPGMGPFSITGQPNAMGGREVGGLANMLAAHMELDDAAHRDSVQQFWNSPTVATSAGRKAVDLFDAIHDGHIKAVWIMGTNPLVSLPDADKVKRALQRCEFVVVSDCVRHTDTNDCAHVLLPATPWGEKDGTVTNSERRISRQRAFLPAAGTAQPDWWIITQVARRMGFAAAFTFESNADVFREHAQLSGVGNHGTRAFDISGLAGLSQAQYDTLAPLQWPVPSPDHPGTARLFSDGRFFHRDGKARFVATTPRMPAHLTDAEYPLVLNTGRIRDQWHTMTRTGHAPRLTAHLPEPFVDMHPQDALMAAVRAGDLVRVATRWGTLVARLRTSGEMPRGMIFVPMHWNGVFASDARVGALVNPVVDPLSGEPELKHTPARVMPFVVSWHGFALTRQRLHFTDVTWWSQALGARFVRTELAGRRVHGDWSGWTRRLLQVDADADWLEYSDPAAGVYRAAWLRDDRIEACIFISPRQDLPSRTWLASLFDKPRLSEADRHSVLIGRCLDARADAGPTVCSCFGVGRKTICAAIERHALRTAQEVGARTRAGTNCGSCLGEIKALLSAAQAQHSLDAISYATR